MDAVLFEGIAEGGPRTGVKLSAPAQWSGRIFYSTGKAQACHPGRYKWDDAKHTWVWYADGR